MAPLLTLVAVSLFAIRGGGHGGVDESSSKSSTKQLQQKKRGTKADRDRIFHRIARIKDDEDVVLFPTLSRRRSEPLPTARIIPKKPKFGGGGGKGDESGDAEEEVVEDADAAAAPKGGGGFGWDVPIHGWVYEPEHSSLRRRAFLSLLRSALDLDREEEANEILTRRVRPFLVDNERGRALTVEITGGRVVDSDGKTTAKASVRKRMPRSHRNGHFRGTLHVTDEEMKSLGYNDDDDASEGTSSSCTSSSSSSSKTLQVRIVHPKESERSFTSRTHLLQPNGLSVISDIDDTIKLSNVLDKGALMRNTFLEEFKPIPGMAELYRRWEHSLGASFHFVSSSPWQLYAELADFMDGSKFPSGSFHLRSIRIKDHTILNLLADPYETKVGTIEGIMDAYPGRTFVLVGDTGEKDPEVYGEICRRYGGRVWRVYLRDVSGGSSSGGRRGQEVKDGDGGDNGGGDNGSDDEAGRLKRAFKGVPDGVWSVFTDANEVSMPPPRKYAAI